MRIPTPLPYPKAAIKNKILALVVLSLAFALLDGCSGTSTPNYSTPTTTNPGGGVSLVAINITPATSLISLAENRQLDAIGVYSDGSSQLLNSQVTWSASSPSGTTSNIAVSSSGIATGMAFGSGIVSATVGNVTGLLQLTVDTNGYSSNSIAVLSVPYKTGVIDAAYMAESQNLIQGAYAVQEVNLDADQFSSVLPVQLALLNSIPMPAGFVPNATIANQSSFLVAVISYSSPAVQIVDASNLSTDVNNNLVVSTFTSPVTQTVTINGISCMICAGVVNPLNGQLILSTAQGFYSLDMVAGKFTALPFSPAPAPTANFTLNPTAVDPYLLTASPTTGEVQSLDLTTNAVTTLNSGLTTPGATAINLYAGYGAVVDAVTNNQSLITFVNSQPPEFSLVSDVSVCAGEPDVLNMVVAGASANPSVSLINSTLFTSQTSGGCVGLEFWPLAGSGQLLASDVPYGYGVMPPTPDGATFVNGTDPNAITAFNDVSNSSHTNYGLLLDANQQWMGRINFASAFSGANISLNNGNATLPTGQAIPSTNLCTFSVNCAASSAPVLYLPTPSTAVTLSVNTLSFGSVSVGAQSPPLPVTIAEIGNGIVTEQITLAGTNPGDFALISTCALQLQPRSSCTVTVTFTPTTTGARSAILSVSTPGNPTQTVALSGTGM